MAIRFKNVTESAGINSTREETFSVSWVNFNNDGKPDLWISPHGYRQGAENTPRLYLNQGNGKFTNIISQVWPVGVEADSHGSSWADFDNDGDPDLFVSVGAQRGTGIGHKQLFVNNQGKLQERAATLGLDYSLGRGRSSLWFDWNRDGLLDILQVNKIRPDGRAPTTLFRQTADGFKSVNKPVGLRVSESSLFAQLADLSSDGSPDLVIHGDAAYPHKVYDTTTVPFKDLTNRFPAYGSVQDVVIADFDGDLHSDFFLVRSKVQQEEVSSVFKAADQHLALAQLLAKTGEVGVSFRTTGNVLFDFREALTTQAGEASPDKILPAQIFIGAKGRHPSKLGFTLAPNDPTVRGIKPRTSSSQEGLYIGYNQASQTWQAMVHSPNDLSLNLIIETSKPLSNLARIGFGPLDLPRRDLQDVLLLHNRANDRYVDRTSGSGLSNPLLGQSVVAGDFDNDMDVDLYVYCAYKTFNLPSVLYENRGNGTFIKVANAGGAAGFNQGPHFPERGSKIAVADYNVDGFLDLFVSNTIFKATQKTYLT